MISFFVETYSKALDLLLLSSLWFQPVSEYLLIVTDSMKNIILLIWNNLFPFVLQVYYPDKLKACFECVQSLCLCILVFAQESYIWTQSEPKTIIFVIAPL